MSLPLTRTALAALLSATLLLAGCSGDDASSEGKDDPSSAGSATSSDAGADEGDAGDEPAASGTLEELTKEKFYDAIISAQRDAGSYRGKATTTTNGVATVLEAEGAYLDSGIAAHAKSSPESGENFETILIDGVMYLTGSGLGVPDGTWVKFDPEDPETASSPFASILKLADPELALRAVGEPKEFELIGTEEVEGVETNHYRVVIDSATYAENLDLPSEVTSVLPAEIEYDMWVDAQNRPIRMLQELEVQGIKTSTEQIYYDYGADVDIKAPADADVVSPDQLS